MKSYHRNANDTVYTITRAYDKAVRDIEEEIRKIYDKFAIDGNLSPAEARKMLNSRVSVKELDKLRKQIASVKDKDIKRHLLSLLNAPAYKTRITRLEALKKQIYIQSKLIADVEITASTSQYIDTINNAYYKHIFDIQKGLGLGFDVVVMGSKTIESILKNPWSGKHFSKRVWHNTDVLAEKLTEIITSGLMSGKNIDKMVKELGEYIDYGKHAAVRVIRTEITYMANSAEMESYKECGIKKYIYVATLDNRTSTICQELDGKTFEVDKAVPGENMPPMHPHCRSTTRAYLGKKTLKNIKRRARDPKTGKTYLVPGDMSYKEWYQKHVIDKYGKDQVGIMKKKVLNKSKDKEQYKRYKKVLGKDMPVKSFDKFQDLKYNGGEKWEALRLNFRDQKIRNYIKSKSQIKTIDPGKQGKHLLGHNNYIEGRSYLTVSLEEVQQLVDRYAGTGEIIRDKSGKWRKQEVIKANKQIGINIDNITGEQYATSKAKIHYSKKGVHIVPYGKG